MPMNPMEMIPVIPKNPKKKKKKKTGITDEKSKENIHHPVFRAGSNSSEDELDEDDYDEDEDSDFFDEDDEDGSRRGKRKRGRARAPTDFDGSEPPPFAFKSAAKKKDRNESDHEDDEEDLEGDLEDEDGDDEETDVDDGEDYEDDEEDDESDDDDDEAGSSEGFFKNEISDDEEMTFDRRPDKLRDYEDDESVTDDGLEMPSLHIPDGGARFHREESRTVTMMTMTHTMTMTQTHTANTVESPPIRGPYSILHDERKADSPVGDTLSGTDFTIKEPLKSSQKNKRAGFNNAMAIDKLHELILARMETPCLQTLSRIIRLARRLTSLGRVRLIDLAHEMGPLLVKNPCPPASTDEKGLENDQRKTAQFFVYLISNPSISMLYDGRTQGDIHSLHRNWEKRH